MLFVALGTPVLAEDFGDQQIAQMLNDRPSMRDIIPRNHAIYRFVSEHFSGGGLNGADVYWDQTEPIDGAENYCQSACVVRVTKSDKFTGRDKWAMLVFELFNIYSGADAELRSRVARNEISKDEFVMRALAREIEAMRQTQEFLRKHPVPGVAASVDRLYFGFLNTPSTLDEYVRFLDRKKNSLSYDPREYNAEVYESLRPPPPATQDARSPRFSITETSAQTTLHDRLSGISWVLVESPELHWAPVPEPANIASSTEQAGDTASPLRGIQLTAAIPRKVQAGRPILTRATLTNRSKVSQDKLRVAFAPPTGAIISAATLGMNRDGESWVSEVEQLAAGETRTFEVLLQFDDDLVGQRSAIVWTVGDSAGAQEKATVYTSVTSVEE